MFSGTTPVDTLQDVATLTGSAAGQKGGEDVSYPTRSAVMVELWVELESNAGATLAEFILEVSIDGQLWAEATRISLNSGLLGTGPRVFKSQVARENDGSLGKRARLRYEVTGGSVVAGAKLLRRE